MEYEVVVSSEMLYVNHARVAVMVDHDARRLIIDAAALPSRVAEAAFLAGRQSVLHRPIPVVRPRWAEA